MGRAVRPFVLAVHGSSLPTAAATLERLCDAVEDLGGIRPVVGHLDHQSPSLAEALSEGAVVVPLLLGDGYHRTVDIPAVVEGRGIGCLLARGLSGEPAIAVALRDRLREAEERAGVRADAVVLAAAGSSRAGGNDGARVAARQVRLLLPGVPVRVAYCSAAEPSVPEVVAGLRGAGHRRVVVATHLLAPGRFTVALSSAGADAVAAPLADHVGVARLVLRRYEAVLLRGSGVRPEPALLPEAA
ncbi:Sirohydrochlorin ferrochelatase [Streptomyces formicae]|uniref:Sirohydrochlorin ferrochelatase n=1 Tax=Streptomyces formicae TaxID=1616117 RepID=A0A291QA69_9ACTN|nr:Sirohydrochlorin ferrochelatase [Streptomyces formicae]